MAGNWMDDLAKESIRKAKEEADRMKDYKKQKDEIQKEIDMKKAGFS